MKLSCKNEPLEAIGHLWDQLTELSRKDPNKYQEVIQESAKEYSKLKTAPLPHTCFHIQEKVATIICNTTMLNLIKLLSA